jgi:hypothetical protein
VKKMMLASRDTLFYNQIMILTDAASRGDFAAA